MSLSASMDTVPKSAAFHAEYMYLQFLASASPRIVSESDCFSEAGQRRRALEYQSRAGAKRRV